MRYLCGEIVTLIRGKRQSLFFLKSLSIIGSSFIISTLIFEKSKIDFAKINLELLKHRAKKMIFFGSNKLICFICQDIERKQHGLPFNLNCFLLA